MSASSFLSSAPFDNSNTQLQPKKRIRSNSSKITTQKHSNTYKAPKYSDYTQKSFQTLENMNNRTYKQPRNYYSSYHDDNDTDIDSDDDSSTSMDTFNNNILPFPQISNNTNQTMFSNPTLTTPYATYPAVETQSLPATNIDTSITSPSSSIVLNKLNHIITMIEEQQDERTNSVMEEIILYCFLGIFIIFIVDSFSKFQFKE